MIPRIIHQTWKTAAVPAEWEAAVRSCKQAHPDYTHMLWTDASMRAFVEREYPESLAVYTGYPHDIQRCDAFRYFVLYALGGVYLDLDIACKTGLDALLGYGVVLAMSSNQSSSFTNAFIMAEPKHPLMRLAVRNLPAFKDEARYLGKHLHVMSSTGPYFLSTMLAAYGVPEDARVLTRAEYSGDCTVCSDGACRGGVYFTHLIGNSWHSLDSTVYNFCACNPATVALAAIVALVALSP
jgi:mannosyltransferase OCH1-like enzyme